MYQQVRYASKLNVADWAHSIVSNELGNMAMDTMGFSHVRVESLLRHERWSVAADVTRKHGITHRGTLSLLAGNARVHGGGGDVQQADKGPPLVRELENEVSPRCNVEDRVT